LFERFKFRDPHLPRLYTAINLTRIRLLCDVAFVIPYPSDTAVVNRLSRNMCPAVSVILYILIFATGFTTELTSKLVTKFRVDGRERVCIRLTILVLFCVEERRKGILSIEF
jgi:hypothetical protein